MEVATVLQANVYDLNDEEKEPTIKKWLGREGLKFIQPPTYMEEVCKNVTGLFNVLKEKFRSQHNEMMILLQHCKLQRKENESTPQWI